MASYDRDVFLEQIIQEYLRVREPIGSEMLKSSLSLKISSATIRNYFKDLMKEGALVQSHISSGRIPTEMALKSYWRSRLSYLECGVDFTALRRAAARFGVFILLREYGENFLEKVSRMNQEILVLRFSQDSIAIDYQPKMERFLSELVGLELTEIKKIAHQVMANELFEKLDWLSSRYVKHFGLGALAPLLESEQHQDLFFEIISGQILDKVSAGLFFDPILPYGFMGILQNVDCAERAMQMLTIGPLVCDYEGFYEQVAA